MRFLLTALGSHGDVHPFLAIGQELRARGHDVSIVVNPVFEELAARTGIPCQQIDSAEHFEQVVAHPDLWHPRRAFPLIIRECVIPSLRDTYNLVAQAASESAARGPLVVVGHPLDLGSRIAQEKLGVHFASILLAPTIFRSHAVPPVVPPLFSHPRTPRWLFRFQYWLADKILVDPALCGELNKFRRELGLPPIRRPLNEWWLSSERIIGMFPDWFAPPQRDWPAQTRLTSFARWDERSFTALPKKVEEFLSAGDPPIIFTPGSANAQARKFFDAAIDACQREGWRAILLTRFPEQVRTSLPSTIAQFDYIPFSQVFPQAKAVVHHGGIGTTAQSIAAGVPQLIMPLAHDQHDNAARIERLGLSRTLVPRRFTARRVARTLRELFESPGRAERCREHGARLREENGVGPTCDLLEQLGESAT